MTLEEYDKKLKLLTQELHKFREEHEVSELRRQLADREEQLQHIFKSVCALVKAMDPFLTDEFIENYDGALKGWSDEIEMRIGWVKYYMPGGHQYEDNNMDWERSNHD